MKHFTKKLALLTLLAGLCGSAWAVETGTATVKMTYIDGSNTTTSYGEVNQSKAGYNNISNNAVGLANSGWGVNFITFLQVDASGINGTISKATLSIDVSGSTDSKRTTTWGVGYNTSAWSNTLTWETANRTITTLGNTQTTNTKSSTTFETKVFDISKAFEGDADKIVTLLIYETAAAGGYIQNPSVSIEYVAASATTAAYTINYVNESNVKIKDSKSGIGEVNSYYTLTDDDKASVFYNGVKYIYSSDDAASNKIADDGSTVITVKFREAETWNYSVKAVREGTELGTISSSTVYEGESVTVAYPQYVLSGTTLYNIANNGSGDWYRTSFTPTEDNYTKELSYAKGTVENVVFYTEAENIEDVSTANYANRASNGLVAYTQESKNIITTLEPGKYKIFIRGLNGNNATRTVNFYLNDATDAVFTFGITKGTNQTGNSEEFTVAETSELSFTCEGSSSSGLDWLYIVKTGDVVSPPVTLNIGTIGYATLYYSDRALIVPAGVEAYTYTVTEGGAAYSTIYSEGEVIPKDEAVVIYKQGGGEAIFEVSSENPDKSSDNMLKGFDAPHLTEGGDYYYALSLNASGDPSSIGFYWKEENGGAFESVAHKAYLALNNTFANLTGGSVKSFYAFGNSTTAIQGIDMNASTKDAVIYNLAGQRVSAPVKGNMYIVNGKKVMMK